MKKLKIRWTRLSGTALFITGMLAALTFCSSIHVIAGESDGITVRADTIFPQSIQSIRVIIKNGKKTTLIYLKNGKAAELKNGEIIELNDSLSKIFIRQYFESESKVFKFVQQMPSFPGGEKALKKYLGEHIHYPKVARENGIQGTVVVQFIVGTNGKLRDFTVVSRKLGGGLEEEAIRVVRAMPDWIPGRQDGEAVNVQYSLPVRFVLP